ncbi:50S ribosomal protein L25/general stress protein Ctc [Corynebacterium sp. TAE3-ERU12]|uniref:50S ribosomal protein L25/general stress protein Ctc n=1 Tax=Corynebacterium sp. TAE3-ERU12 TaxID=2849491 RepID=UPI001C465D7E|nr:50S ribosomal protein L25/general stress protein Ctc [Corynebacterium sp. TAE3-ERU12]MBV7295686.1 50S ribosomal protein L25/general stress protein Ctc [Corynebacterium sp. TAE3-ERU12]
MAKKPNITKLDAESRTEFGKGAARRLRRASKIPAVIYGGELESPLHIAMDQLEFNSIIRNYGINAIVEFTIDGEKQLSMIKAVDQNPLTFEFDHVDMLAIKRGEKVEVEVPIVSVGEAEVGSLVMQDADSLLVLAPVLSIPEEIEVNIEGLEVGTQVMSGDITMPEGIELADDDDLLVFNIVEPEEDPAGDVDADIEGMGEDELPDEETEEESADTEGADEE